MQIKVSTVDSLQSTASKKHVYDYSVNLDADTAPARVVRMVGHKKVVLEVGSGPGSITKLLSSVSECQVTALEVDPTAIEIVKNYCTAVVPADLNDPEWPNCFKGKQFDRVIAADVLEHVNKPLDVLLGMKSLLNSDGEIVVSLPHIGHAGILASLLDADFKYNDWGLLDRTHIRFFGLKNIDSLFDAAGLAIIEVQFVVRHPLETEFAAIWNKLTSKSQKLISSKNSTFVYQVVLRAAPNARVSQAQKVQTTPISIPKPSLAAVAKQMLPRGIKTVLKQLIGRK